MDLIKALFDFITDTRRKITHKISLAIVIILGLIFVNNVFGFTYFYRNDRKVEQLKAIHELLKDSTLSPAVKNDLHALEARTMKRTIWLDDVMDFFRRPTESKPSVLIDTVYVQNGKLIARTDHTVTKRNPYWHFFTSAFPWILLTFAIPFAYTDQKGVSRVGALLAAFVIILGFAFFWSFIFGLIPIIGNHPWINYVLNFVLNTVLLVGLAMNSTRTK